MNTIDINNTSAKSPHSDEWLLINWKKINHYVKRLRQRIFRAEQLGQKRKVKKLQRLMLRSKANLLLSIKKVTQKNQGKKTPGIDGYLALNSLERMKLFSKMVDENIRNAHAVPVRRIFIPKKEKGKMRPLGIPVIKDRVYQNIAKNALEPQWEARFEPTMYGFRPKRGVHDAISHIHIKLHAGTKREWIFEGDYKGCFDNISHDYIMDCIKDFPAKNIIHKWLKAGYVCNNTLEATNLGTPQGGLISPLLANISLNGLNEEISVKYEWRKHTGYGLKKKSLGTIVYADDFLILCHTKEEAESMYEKLEPYLKKRGLTLAQNKTKITNIKDGFDFLGFNVRQYSTKDGMKLLIKPSKNSINKVQESIKEIFVETRGTAVKNVITKLNPVLRGTANFWSTQVSKKAYSKIDSYIWTITHKHLSRLHPNKGWNWKNNKYFKPDFTGVSKDRNIFTDPENSKLQLIKMAWTPIIRHKPIKHNNSPDDPSLKEYFEKRDEKTFCKEHIKSMQKIASKNNYKCRICGLSLVGREKIKANYIIPKKIGGQDKYINLEALHLSCHKIHQYLLMKYGGGRDLHKLKQYMDDNNISSEKKEGISKIKNRFRYFKYQFVRDK